MEFYVCNAMHFSHVGNESANCSAAWLVHTYPPMHPLITALMEQIRIGQSPLVRARHNIYPECYSCDEFRRVLGTLHAVFAARSVYMQVASSLLAVDISVASTG